MFQLFLGIILTFGLFRNMMTRGQYIGVNCDKDFAGSSRAIRCTSTSNCQQHHHHHTTFCLDCGTNNCNVDKKVISDNCWNCCCNRISPAPSVNDNYWGSGTTAVTTGCGTLSADCNSKNIESDISGEGDEYSLSAPLNSGKTLSEIESKCPLCPLPPSSPPPPPCPLTSNGQRFSRDSNNQLLNRNFTLPFLPEGMPIIPSPQLDLLTSGASLKFANIQDLYLSTTTSPPGSNEKLPVQDSPANDFSSYDCCTRCNGASCTTQNSSTIMLASNIYKSKRNRGTKCKNKELRKLMMANIKRDPTRSKRAIQRAGEKKFGVEFNVICSKDDFSYVTHTIEYCEVFGKGTVCYAFKTH